MAIPLLAAVLLLSIGASVSIVSRKFHQVNATTWVKYYFQMIENMSLGLSVGIVQSGYRSPKIAANGLYWRRARIVLLMFNPCRMLNSSTNAQFITSACLLPIHCCTLFFFGIQLITTMLITFNKIIIKLFGN